MKELKAIEKLKDSFTYFPSIGSKSAERMAYAILDMDEKQVETLIKNIEEAKTKIHQCPKCGLLTEEPECSICTDEDRDHTTCIVLAYPKDVQAFEKGGTYNGVYHILNGLINLSKNVGPSDIRIDELISRIHEEGIKELIIATDPTVDGETTALYISKLLENEDIKITRLAYGMPIGASFDYIDSLTIERALKGRTKIK